MKNMNIGIANLIISKQISESLLKDSILKETKEITSNYYNVIKNSPILQLESKVFNNIEKKEINDDVLAIRYIDNNIKLFEIYTIDEIIAEHNKIQNIFNSLNEEMDINKYQMNLYSAINDLILENLKIGDDIDVDRVHESYQIVLEHVKKTKPKIDNIISEEINESVIEIAIEKFNEKYSKMNEEDSNMLKTIISSSFDEKKKLFNEYKKNNIDKLNELKKENADNSKVDKTINKINEMKIISENIDYDIIKLYELNRGLI